MHLPVAILLFLFALYAEAQENFQQANGALTFARSINVPLNAVKMYDQAQESWQWTFGQEPGAVIRRSDRGDGTIEGVARMSFRSTMLTMREETMGVIQYRVTIQTHAGECRIQVAELVHTGNKRAMRGGSHVGPIMRGTGPAQKVKGMSAGNARRLHEEMQVVATQRIRSLIAAFEGRLRAGAEP